MSFENERKHSWSFVPGLVFTIVCTPSRFLRVMEDSAVASIAPFKLAMPPRQEPGLHLNRYPRRVWIK